MYWYKVKNMLITLFAVLNIFLLAMIVFSNMSAAKREKELSETLLTVLEKNGISVDGQLMKEKKTKVRIYKIENLVEDTSAFAGKLTGAKAEKVSDAEGNSCYVSGTKKVYVNSGRFMMTDSSVPNTMQTEADKEAAKEFFKEIGVDLNEADCRIQGEKIVFTFKIGNMPIYEKELYAKMYGGVMAECGGNLIKILGTEGNESKDLVVREALLRFLRDPDRVQTPYSVKEVNIGYWVVLGDESVNFKFIDAVPAYEVVTDKGNYYYYN